MRHRTLIALAIAATVALAACSGSSSGLTGKTWQLTALTHRVANGLGGVPEADQANYTIEFKSDGGVIDGTPMSPILLGKWKTLSSKSDTNTLTVELKDSSNTKKLDIKVLDNDHLRITPDGGPGEFYFKRDSSK